jgi:hypothetical protein
MVSCSSSSTLINLSRTCVHLHFGTPIVSNALFHLSTFTDVVPATKLDLLYGPPTTLRHLMRCSYKACILISRSFVTLLRVSTVFAIRRPLELERKNRLCLYAIKSTCFKLQIQHSLRGSRLRETSSAVPAHPFLCLHVTFTPTFRSTHCADTRCAAQALTASTISILHSILRLNSDLFRVSLVVPFLGALLTWLLLLTLLPCRLHQLQPQAYIFRNSSLSHSLAIISL